jgi:Effector Associated Constant Component 1
VDVRVSAEGENPADELESLRDWLADTGELKGRVSGVELPPPVGALGPVLDSVLIAMGPGGAAAAFATALVSWLRHRGSSVKIRVELSDGTAVRVDATDVRRFGVAELRSLVATVTDAVGQARKAAGGADPEMDLRG